MSDPLEDEARRMLEPLDGATPPTRGFRASLREAFLDASEQDRETTAESRDGAAKEVMDVDTQLEHLVRDIHVFGDDAIPVRNTFRDELRRGFLADPASADRSVEAGRPEGSTPESVAPAETVEPERRGRLLMFMGVIGSVAAAIALLVRTMPSDITPEPTGWELMNASDAGAVYFDGEPLASTGKDTMSALRDAEWVDSGASTLASIR